MPADLGLTGFDDFEEIGSGAFGVVYRAHQIDLDRVVAVKVLSGVVDDAGRARFDRERRALGALSEHPNIVAVYSSGLTAEGRPYIVMEFAPGGSLADRIRREGPMAWRDVVTMTAKLADALSASHAKKVLHRDVKPENVLFSTYGEPMLADFGIARIVGTGATRTGVVTASVAHAAPEVLDGERPSEAADVYSLASTAFAAIAGQAPFVRATDESMIPVIARVASQPPPDLRSEGAPDQVATVLEQGLAKDPAARASAVGFATALRTTATTSDDARPARPRPVADVPTNLAGRAQGTDTAGATTPTVPDTPTRAVAERNGSWWAANRRWVGVAGGGAVVLTIVVVLALAGGGGTSHASKHTTPATSGPTPITASTQAEQAVLHSLENITQQSAAARSQLGSLLAGVQNGCQTDLSTASQQIQSVIDNRNSLLGQLAAITIPSGAANPDNVGALVSTLQQAIQSSINADIQYKSWIGFIESNFDYVDCPGGAPPTNDAFNLARQDDQNSTTLKTQFASTFNPIAGRFGLATVDPGTF